MLRIKSSVGRGGRNLSTDVVVVQTLLNRHIVPPANLLAVDGVVGPKTVRSIVVLQHRLRLEVCDGRVDPCGRTFQSLLSRPGSIHVTSNLGFSFDDAITMVAKVTDGLMQHFSAPSKPVPSPNRPPPRNPPPIPRPAGDNPIAWGAKVSPEFKRRVIEICKELEMSPDYLMTCMAFETGETFRADQPNLNGGSAIGLIQFTKAGWTPLKTTRAELKKMTAVEQLEYVRKYFLPYKGRLKTLEDVYMAILCPAAVGKGPDGVLYSKNSIRSDQYYIANSALDNNPKDGKITVSECAAVLLKKYQKGLRTPYLG